MAIKIENGTTFVIPTSGNPTTLTLDLGFTPKAGNMLWVAGTLGGPIAETLTSIALGKIVQLGGTPWTVNVSQPIEPGLFNGYVFTAHAPNIGFTSNELLLSFGSTIGRGAVVVLELSGVKKVLPNSATAGVDLEIGETPSGISVDSGIATSDSINEFAISLVAADSAARSFTINNTDYALAANVLGVSEELWAYTKPVPFSGTDIDIQGGMDSLVDNIAIVELFEAEPVEDLAEFESPFAKKEDHVATAKANVIGQFKDKTQFLGLIESYVKQIQSLETVFCQVLSERALVNATGATLEGIGEILNEPRSGRTDSNYRVELRTKAKALASVGTIEEIIAVFNVLGQGGITLEIEEKPPATVKIETTQNLTAPLSVNALARILKIIHPAGVRVIFSDSQSSFRFDTPGFGFDEGTFGGSL